MEDDSSGSPAAAASCPRWVMLKNCGYQRYRYSTVQEAKAAAAARTSTHLLFHVSLHLAVPPASSRFYYGWLDSPSNQDGWRVQMQVDALTAVAVHGDAVLLEVRTSEKHSLHRPYGSTTAITDYFLYDNGAPARPPSLLLLPGCYFAWHYELKHNKAHGCCRPTARKMNKFTTGILRCGEDELLVAQLELPCDEPWDRVELCVLRLGQETQDWKLKREVPIIFDDLEGIKGDEVMRQWQTETVTAIIPVGDRFLCWVDYRLGFLLCDMAADDDSLKLRYVALPVQRPHKRSYFDCHPCMKYSRNLASAGAGVVRFVNVEPRCCCCGSQGRSTCDRCVFFTVTTWTLSLSMEEPMEWVKDGVLDCDELWALPAYEGLPQVKFELPIVSLDDPDVICFTVRDPNYNNFTYMREWMVEVDMRSKAILFVVACKGRCVRPEDHVVAKLRCLPGPASSLSKHENTRAISSNVLKHKSTHGN